MVIEEECGVGEYLVFSYMPLLLLSGGLIKMNFDKKYIDFKDRIVNPDEVEDDYDFNFAVYLASVAEE
jgi:hypothetical protein